MISAPIDTSVLPAIDADADTDASASTYAYKNHTSVLKNEVLTYLTENIKSSTITNASGGKNNLIFADLTFGGGGHTFSLLERLSSIIDENINVQVIAFDQDPDAISNGHKKISELSLDNKIKLIHSNFTNFVSYINSQHLEIIHDFSGILLDLGVSSHQFDTTERGLSFKGNAPLDMRMNYADNSLYTAGHYVNNLSEKELVQVISEYGEDRFAKKIASSIVKQREIKTIETTSELENIIFHSYPQKFRYSRSNNKKHIHPATKTFQALRLLVNNELNVLKETLPKLFDLLSNNGRLVCISFHSLEDRIVKQTFKEIKEKNKENCSILTKKPIIPSEEEIKNNLRSRSAKLRVIEKTEGGANDRKWSKSTYP
ncbi:MAG: 16S rRNA (cytosine(1402)-N(4))-methyltransferase RsmH [Oligoflexia bacterium]|nr:16S rRNA (cytosine(1402)-N(4))-methyltransferase RsmH [Oligoflexia bacterium]